MDIITSSKNQLVKNIKSLKMKKYREAERLFVIEGIRFSEEAVNSGWEISNIIISESFDIERYEIFKNTDVNPVIVSDSVFSEISDTENPQGIMMILKMKDCCENVISDEISGQMKNILVLDCIQDPGNMGTIIRTADAFGVDGIYLSDGCVDIYNSKVLRATMGSIFHIPVFRGMGAEEIILKLKQNGYKVYGSHLKGCDLDKYSAAEGKKAVVIGNEANGISDTVTAVSDFLVRIPMRGQAESLNASVAAGILIYEIFAEDK